MVDGYRHREDLAIPAPSGEHKGRAGRTSLPLEHRVEDAKVGDRVGATTGRPLPAQGVIGEVGIDRRILEPLSASLPGDEQMFYQKRGHHHAHTVVHPACRP